MLFADKKDLKEARKLLRQFIRKKKFLPKYVECKKFPKAIIENTNCYGYVFEFFMHEYDPRLFGFLGFTIGNYVPVKDQEKAKSLFKTDVTTMGRKIMETDSTIPTKGFKIAFFLSNEKECDFHFMRMDNDGTWSEKDGYKGEIRKVVKASGEPALPDEINYENWTFQGYYWIL